TTLRRMNQESGGDPNIVNRWDSNWKAGTPSVGLMQVIGPTFRAYAGKYRKTGPFSYGVSTNPLANIYSSMRYALSRYGSLPRAYDRPGGYDSGGWLGPGQT
ncbi:transglycosylase SLT domain-containing protein, partial [Streptomyces sp. NRRL S-1896]